MLNCLLSCEVSFMVSLSIILNRNNQYTSHFWKVFQNVFGSNVKLSTTFHPQIDVQGEHTIKIIEDMLRACVIDFSGLFV